MSQALHHDDPSFYAIPENAEEIAQMVLLLEMGLPLGQDLGDQIGIDRHFLKITVVTANLTAKELRQLKFDAEHVFASMADGQYSIEGMGSQVMFAFMSKHNIDNMISGATIVFIIICLSLVIIFRDVRLVVPIFVAILLPILLAFGIWGIMYDQVGVAATAVLGIGVGIVADDAIHFLHHFLITLRQSGRTVEEAIATSLRTTGRAIAVTSTILVVGFLFLSRSHFEINRSMGLLMALVVMTALAVTFVGVPAFLRIAYSDRKFFRKLV